MKAFAEFQARQVKRLLETWPAEIPDGMPEALRSLSREQARQAFSEAAAAEGMPDAELTPELVEFRNASREANRQSHIAFLEMGKSLLGLRATRSEWEFWRFVSDKMPGKEEDAELAMKCAREAGF